MSRRVAGAERRVATQCDGLQRRATGCSAERQLAMLYDALEHVPTWCNVVRRVATRRDAMQRRATDCNTARRVATQYSTYRASERAAASACASQRRARALAQGSQASAATYPYNPRISNTAPRVPDQRLCGFGCNTHRCSAQHASMQRGACTRCIDATRDMQHAPRHMEDCIAQRATCTQHARSDVQRHRSMQQEGRAFSCTCTRSPDSFGFVATAPTASAANVVADDVACPAPSRACEPGGSG
jgi:hypothetical protein